MDTRKSFQSCSSIASLLRSVQSLSLCNLYERQGAVVDCGRDVRLVKASPRLLIRRSLGEPSRSRTTVGFWRQTNLTSGDNSAETLHIERMHPQNGPAKPRRITSGTKSPRRNSWNLEKPRSSLTARYCDTETSQASQEHSNRRRILISLRSAQKIRKPPGTLKLDIIVKHINFKPDPNGDKSTDFQSNVSQFYDKILSNKDLYIHALSSMPLLKDNCVVEDLRMGSLHLVVRVLSVESMDTLIRALQSGELGGIMNNTLVSQHLMDSLGLSNLVVQVKMKDAKKVRDELLSVHAMRNTPRHGSGLARPKTSLGICKAGEEGRAIKDISITKLFCTRKLKSIAEHSTVEGTMLIKRLEVLYASLDDFLMTLKLAKPRNLSEFINLSQVMTIYDYLLESPSVGKNVHTDLVKEFVDIVAALKSILIQQSQDMSLLTKDLVMFVHVEELLMAKELREDVLGMCEECYEFPSSWNLTKVKLSPMDDPIFRRLVAFLPETMKRLDQTVNTILRIRKLVKLHN